MRVLAWFGALLLAVLVATAAGLALGTPYDWRHGLRDAIFWMAFLGALALAGVIDIDIDPERR